MQTSLNIDQLMTALAKARAAFPTITRTKTVQVRSERGAYAFAYAPLEDILAAVCPPLSAEGLVLVGSLDHAPDGAVLVTTRLAHASGQWVESAINVGRHGKLQELGSAITYGRRYGISTLLGIQTDDDDDANAADGNTILTPQPATASTTATATPARPSKEQVDDLVSLALLSTTKDGFAQDIRRLLQVGGEVAITKKFLREHLTMTQFAEAWARYEAANRRAIEADVDDFPPQGARSARGMAQGVGAGGELITTGPGDAVAADGVEGAS
jgi:hypothetical protein